MRILKINQLQHSGLGRDAIHVKVIDAFSVSEQNGLEYCKSNKLDVAITDTSLNVRSQGSYPFIMGALIHKD